VANALGNTLASAFVPMLGLTTRRRPATVPLVEPWLIRPAAFCGTALANSGRSLESTALSSFAQVTSPVPSGFTMSVSGENRMTPYESEMPLTMAP